MLSKIYIVDTATKQKITKQEPTLQGNYILVSATFDNNGCLKSIDIKVATKKDETEEYSFHCDVNEYISCEYRCYNLISSAWAVVDDISKPQEYSCDAVVDDVQGKEKLFLCFLGGLIHQVAYAYLALKSVQNKDKQAKSFCDDGSLHVLPSAITNDKYVPEILTHAVWPYVDFVSQVYASVLSGVAAVLITKSIEFMNLFGCYFVDEKCIECVDINDAFPVVIRIIYCAVLLMTKAQVSELVDSRDEILQEISKRLKQALAKIEDSADDAAQEVSSNLTSTIETITQEQTKNNVQEEVTSINEEVKKAENLVTSLKDVLRLV